MFAILAPSRQLFKLHTRIYLFVKSKFQKLLKISETFTSGFLAQKKNFLLMYPLLQFAETENTNIFANTYVISVFLVNE